MTQTFTIYNIMGNTDQTEGRGSEVVRESWHDLEAAIRRVKSPEAIRKYGVMGVSPITLSATTYTLNDDGSVTSDKNTIYGYRRDRAGKWSYGFLDLSDSVIDPDFVKYLELKERFEPL